MLQPAITSPFGHCYNVCVLLLLLGISDTSVGFVVLQLTQTQINNSHSNHYSIDLLLLPVVSMSEGMVYSTRYKTCRICKR